MLRHVLEEGEEIQLCNPSTFLALNSNNNLKNPPALFKKKKISQEE